MKGYRLTPTDLSHIVAANLNAPVSAQNPAIDEMADEIMRLREERMRLQIIITKYRSVFWKLWDKGGKMKAELRELMTQ